MKGFIKCSAKLITIFLFFIICLLLQVTLSPTGYNYIGYGVLLLIFLYFEEIKTISLGGIKLEKYGKLTNKIEKSIVALFRIQLKRVADESQEFWAQETMLLSTQS